MSYTLDTNLCIVYLNGRNPQIVEKLSRIPAQEITVCSVVRAELFTGAEKSQLPNRTMEKYVRFLLPYKTLAFDDNAAAHYGRIRATLEQAGTPIGPLDMLIAAIALANDLTLVTHNTREFIRVPNLKLEDWQD